MGYEERWEVEREEGYRNRNPAAVAVVIVLCFVFLGGVVLATVYGGWWWVALFTGTAVTGLIAAIAQGNAR